MLVTLRARLLRGMSCLSDSSRMESRAVKEKRRRDEPREIYANRETAETYRRGHPHVQPPRRRRGRRGEDRSGSALHIIHKSDVNFKKKKKKKKEEVMEEEKKKKKKKRKWKGTDLS